MTPAPSGGRSLAWHRRLEARVLLGVGLIVGLSLIAILVATERFISANALQRSHQDLQAARAAFYQLIEGRRASAAAQTRLITELPMFRAHMTDTRIAADTATLHEMAEDYRRALAADFSIVTDAAGRWMVHPGWPSTAEVPMPLGDGIAIARTGRSDSAIVAFQARLYLFVIEPAMFTAELLGTVAVGYRLDDGVARELARVTNCDVNLIIGKRLVGSSLPLDARDALAALLSSAGDELTQWTASPARRRFGDSEYLSGVYPLVPDQRTGEAGLVLLRNLGLALALLDQIRTSLLWVGAFTFVVSVGVSLVFSRRLTRPLRQIAIVARDIAAGHVRLFTGGSARPLARADSLGWPGRRVRTASSKWR